MCVYAPVYLHAASLSLPSCADDDAAAGGVASHNLLLPVGYETTSSAISGRGAGPLSLEWIGVLVSRRRPVMEGPLSICDASTAWQREM